jgi:hypothetical protein
MLAVTTSAMLCPALSRDKGMKGGPCRPVAGMSLFSKVNEPLSVEFHSRRHDLNRFIVVRNNANRKVIAVHAMRECEGVEIYLTWAPDEVEQSLYTRGKGSPYPFNTQLVGWQGGCGRLKKRISCFCQESNSRSSTSLP